tara:strand:+ start:129 stop:971 length:843 start_codon:yes stop_codon:yes gene_type:complete
MVKKKDNLKEFNEEEQVIEMGPVKKEDKFSKINFVSIFLSSLSLILVITLFVFFQYKNTGLFEENIFKEKQGLIETINEKEVKLSDKINKINDLTKSMQNEIVRIEKLSKENKVGTIYKNIEVLKNQIEEIKIKINTLNKKIIFLEKEKDENLSSNVNQDKQSNKNSSENYENRKKELLQEFSRIKEILFNKKTYSYANDENEKDLKTIILNYLSGFLNLRDYRENENPRALLTAAETSAFRGDLEGVIINLEKLPDEWKYNLKSFLQESKNFLNSDRLR